MSTREPLDRWQGRLERHFRELSATRDVKRFPLFALEHGLSADERQLIPNILDGQIRSGIPVTDHWLIWAVYAAERGYVYDGHEYWDTFEGGMRRWREAGRRDHLRVFFRRFLKQFGGVTPTGPWADHFRNICWPITHAILPKYLQRQFAKAMYDARHQLAHVRDGNAVEAGNVLARTAIDGSSRFQEFLEQPELAGRIVQAMLGHGTTDVDGPISRPVLERIVADLTETRDAGEWLKETRRVASDRVHGTFRPNAGSTDAEDDDSLPAAAPAIGPVRPKLLLRRAPNGWDTLIEIPSFEDVARVSNELRRFLQSTRCTIAGTDGGKLPPGWTLYGSRQRPLKSWPQDQALLITFEKPNGELDNLLTGECRLSPGPVWLFRVSADGFAREVLGRNLRAAHQYIALSRQRLESRLTYVTPIDVACEGVVALRIDVPDKVEAQDAAELHRLGIVVSRSIEVWPAGPCVQNWDGDGHGEWLSTEEPCLGFTHDHPVDEYVLVLNGGQRTHITGGGAGEKIFVRLPRLAPGRHTLDIRPRRLDPSLPPQSVHQLESRVELNVRDPRPRRLGTTSHSGLFVSVEPPNPSLGDFWTGLTELTVFGPEGREVRCSITLRNSDGNVILDEEIGRYPLPIRGPELRKAFLKFADTSQRSWIFVGATTGLFRVHAEELGTFELRLERSTTPLRWVCRFIGQEAELRLVDDTGQDGAPKVQFYAFSRPTIAASELDASSTIKAAGVGGLYHAVHQEQSDAILVSNRIVSRSFGDLMPPPDLSGWAAETDEILAFAALWYDARPAGPLAESRRELVVGALLDRLYALYCGDRWLGLERAFDGKPASVDKLKFAVDVRPSFAIALRTEYLRSGRLVGSRSAWFADAAKRYGVCADTDIVEFCLRLAGNPFTLSAYYGQKLRSLLDGASKFPSVMRGARFLAMLSIGADQGNSTLRLPRWQ